MRSCPFSIRMVNPHRPYTGLRWVLAWVLGLALATPAVHLGYAFWPYPAMRGVDDLQRNVLDEYRLAYTLFDPRALRWVEDTNRALYRISFEWTGLDGLATQGQRIQTGGNLLAQAWIEATHEPLSAFYWSIRLTALRLAVLLAAAPLFLLGALAAGIDGDCARRLRRYAAGRESGYLYHRYKRALLLCPPLLAACYLLPPIIVDPRWIVPPFATAFVLLARQTLASFKKYL